jgi:NAD(P)H dehydrogenase (quinone)
MKVLVMYYSQTGNTEKLAKLIAEGVREVKGVECVLKPAQKVTRDDFLTADGIIAGSPVYFGTMAAQLKEVFDRYVDVRDRMGDKIGAAFATSGGVSGGKETTILSILQAMLIYGMIVVGDPLEATGHYGVSCVGAPDGSGDLDAASLGRRVAALVRKLRE